MIRSMLMAIPDGGQYPEDPPDGPPTNVRQFTYGDELSGVFYGLQWTSGDVIASTQWAFTSGAEPSVPSGFVSAGLTSVETGVAYTGSLVGWVRHTRGGTPSAWVVAS